MTTTVSSKGRIVLPAAIRRRDGVLPGQKFEIQRIAGGIYRLKRKDAFRNKGLVEWLLTCPEKGWLRSPDRMETTDDIKAIL